MDSPSLFDLPAELLFHIVQFLNGSSLGALVCSSREAVTIFSSAYFWKSQCEIHLPQEEQLISSTDLQVDSEDADLEVPELADPEAMLWKSKFADFHRLRRNWLHGRSKMRSIVDVEGLFEGLQSRVVADGDAIYVGSGHHVQQFLPSGKVSRRSFRKSIRVTDAVNGMRTFDVNEGRIAISGGDLWDAIHLIDVNDGRVLSKWRSSAERGQVINKLQLSGGRIAAAAIQCTLWDIESLTRVIRVKEDEEARSYATSMKAYGNYFGASWASVAAMYDIRSKNKTATFSAKETEITQIDIHEKYVSTNSSDGIVRIWDQRNFEHSLFEIGEHKRGVLASYVDNYKSVSLAGDGRIRICDISEAAETINCTSFKFYGDQVSSMAVTKNSLITLGETIRINDFQVSKPKKSNSFLRGLKSVLVGY